MTSRSLLALALALVACTSAAPVASPRIAPRFALTDDLPPGIVSGESCDLDVTQDAIDHGAIPLQTAGSCTIENAGASLDYVIVTPHHERPFALELTDVDVRVTPAQGRLAQIEVLSPLKFKATARIDWYDVTGTTYDQSGVLYLTPGLVLRDVHPRGAMVEATVETSEGPFARNALVPCGALHIGPLPDERTYWSTPKLAWSLETDEDWLWMAHETDQTLPLEVRLPASLTRTGSRDGQSRVTARLSNGSFLTGWVQKELKTYTPVAAEEVAAKPKRACERRPPPPYAPRGVVYGKATIKGGTWVFVSPDGPGWAEIPYEIEAKIAWVPGSMFVDLVEVQGIRARGGARMVVPLSTVRMTDVKRYDDRGALSATQ